MKYLKNKIFIIGTLLLLYMFSLIQFNFITYNRIEDNSNKFGIPRLSNSNITISTPENKSYFEPMSGYYPATFGFENDKLNESQPMLFNNIYEGDCNGRVIEELDGHKKVFNASDDEQYGSAIILQKFSEAGFENQTYGTIEFWFRVDPGNLLKNTEIRLHWDHSQSHAAINIRVFGALQQWQFHNGTWNQIPNVPDPSNNTWHHIKIQFRCLGADSYLGLNENQFQVIIDGISSGSLNFSQSATQIAMFEPIHTQLGQFHIIQENCAYIDAIGYSWDPNYNIGDNLKEGLLLSFENNTNLDWIGYSLDKSANKTILGNKTINYPNIGLHSIQIFGNDSIGTKYSSDIRYFSVKEPITIITPENKSYFEPMSGYYPATYGFEDDADGQYPEGWGIQQVSGAIEVISELDNHKKVLRLLDNDPDDPTRLYNSFNPKDYGTIELWIRQNHLGVVEDRGQISGYGNGNAIFLVKIVGGSPAEWQVRDNGTDINVVGAPTPLINTWYHVRIDFEHTLEGYQGLGQNEYYVYINGTQYGPYIFTSDEKLDELHLHTYSYGYGYSTYFDAVGYSWDPNYNIGDNLHEGLLLSFETEFTPEWLGYSLDGQTNKTILGNTTIPFLNDGLHTIRVYANNSFGTIYQSNLTYFSIDTSPPEILINSPIDNEFFGVSAPAFDLSINDLNINTTWYTLDIGDINITFHGLSGIINQTEWAKKDSELVTIRFYANDSFGLESYAEVIINKDIDSPSSIISFVPHSGINVVNKSSEFRITANDGIGSGVSIIRYKINDSSWVTYTGPFDLSSYNYGNYLITYQAIDAVGNVELENTLLVLLVKLPSKEPEIPGFSPALILSLIGFVSLILIKRFKK